MQSADPKNKADIAASNEESIVDNTPPEKDSRPKASGGRGRLGPTRCGDWEKAGRCIDF